MNCKQFPKINVRGLNQCRKCDQPSEYWKVRSMNAVLTDIEQRVTLTTRFRCHKYFPFCKFGGGGRKRFSDIWIFAKFLIGLHRVLPIPLFKIWTAHILGPYNSIMSFPSPARIMIFDPHCQTDNLKIIHYFWKNPPQKLFSSLNLLKINSLCN